MERRIASTAMLVILWAGLAHADDRPTLGFYGTPGLVDMPSAESMPDGTLSLTSSFAFKTLRNSLTFQITPRLSGSFRYSLLRDYFPDLSDHTLYDRSFDLRYRLVDEGRYRPALAVGLQDFGGTGIFGGEYFVTTKHVTPRVLATAGIGWGRYGSYNGFENPLAIFGNSLKHRPKFSGPTQTGQVASNRFFHGDAALFAGIEWRYSDRLSLKAEYSSDAYVTETDRMGFRHDSPFNFGATYRFGNGVDLGGYFLYGSTVGVILSYSKDMHESRFPGGAEPAPPPVIARDMAAAASWGSDWQADPGHTATLSAQAEAALKAQGIKLLAMRVDHDSAVLHIRNDRYDKTPEAIGRSARALTAILPPSVESITLVPVTEGIPASAITLRRSDLEELENDLDGSWKSYVRARIADGADFPLTRSAILQKAYPLFSFDVGGYLATSLFDPSSPIRADVGVEVDSSFSPSPGLVFSGELRQPLTGNLKDSRRVSDSTLPHVRSDAAEYDRQSDLELSYLTAEYFFRPRASLFGRITVGYLERMYGGVSAELLWKPAGSRLALGAELNYARQRDFNVQFGFQHYDVVTGHVSAYYDLGKGYLGEIDAGRYLAGDWGATVSLDREFDNGVRLGAFFTLTDVPFSTYGEGSFDKGIRISIPVSYLTGRPDRRAISRTVRPILRDGGARLSIRNRLFELTRSYQDPDLGKQWGRFWR